MRLLLLAAVASLLLAGCGAPPTPPTTGDTTQPPIAAGKGAIAGLVIDDVYRPIPGALILLQGTGFTATSDNVGQFTFTDLTPGAYIAVVSAAGHEAAPKNIDVKEGIYNPLEIEARRVINQGSQIITDQYSVFIPCTFAAPLAGWVTFNCVLDLSGDSFRSSTDFNYTALQNVTYMVAEAKMSQVGNYNFVIRPPGSDLTGEAWGDNIVSNTDYARVQLKMGEENPGGNMVWDNTEEMEAALFVSGQVPDPTDPNGPGVGFNTAVRASIVVSIFLGAPPVAIDSYHVL